MSLSVPDTFQHFIWFIEVLAGDGSIWLFLCKRRGWVLFIILHKWPEIPQINMYHREKFWWVFPYLHHLSSHKKIAISYDKVIYWFRKGRGTRDQIANICWIIEKNRRIPEKHLLLLYWLCQSLLFSRSQQTGKFFKKQECQTTLPASWEICVQVN